MPFKVDGREIILIDTPGFDDTDRSEAHVLEQIANYLHTTYTANYLLTGLILLQPINGNRITGSEMRRTQLFKKILGPNAYERVIIGTTMWNKIAEESSGTMNAVGRQQRNDVWGDMVERGARVMRHDDNRESALRLIRELTKFNTPVALQMQEELSQNGGRIAMTSAGRQLDDDLSVEVNNLREEIAKLQSERIDVQKEIQELRDKLTRVEADRFRLGRMTVSAISLHFLFLFTNTELTYWKDPNYRVNLTGDSTHRGCRTQVCYFVAGLIDVLADSIPLHISVD